MKVVILNDVRDNSLWDIYEESGQMLETGFESEEEAEIYSIDQKWQIVNIIHVK